MDGESGHRLDLSPCGWRRPADRQYNPAMSDPQGAAFGQMTVRELAERRACGRPPRLIDIREPFECALARLAGAEHLPLSEVRRWWRSLEPTEEVVFHCHHGLRSAALCKVLAAEGFEHVHTLVGGIDAWSAEIDPDTPRY